VLFFYYHLLSSRRESACTSGGEKQKIGVEELKETAISVRRSESRLIGVVLYQCRKAEVHTSVPSVLCSGHSAAVIAYDILFSGRGTAVFLVEDTLIELDMFS
jgi:hypothetical protein